MAIATATKAASEDKELLISGSEAVAEALALADIDVVTAYPIRPYDTVMQAIAKKIANGKLVAEYIVAEGEHSQFEIVKHASTVGARVFCGSSGVGWMYAMECLVVTPPLRVPMVALVGNRALDDPGAFGVEHNDALVVRDLGWLLCWIDTSQEALDTTLIAYRVAEDRRIFLPLAISADGAFLTHSQALTMVPPKEKVGLIRLRWFRPFPFERLAQALGRAKAIGVIDRDYSFGSPFHSGVVANEIRAAMYNADKRPPLLSFICGLGGREVMLEDVNRAVDMCYAAATAGKSDGKTHWLGVRE